jgi:hypothetical protein
MSTALEEKIKQTKQQSEFYLSALRELAWCQELSIAVISQNEQIQKICFFETKEVLNENPDWHKGSGMPFFLQDMLGHRFFSQLINNDSCGPSVDIEMFTQHEQIGFQAIPLRIIRVLLQSIQLESQLFQWRAQKIPSVGIKNALTHHSGLSLALVPVRMYDLGQTDNMMPILLNIPHIADGETACIAYTASDRYIQAEPNLREVIQSGYQINKMSLSGNDFLQHFSQQTMLHNICDGILWNPFTKAEFFLPWTVFLSWFESE